jgi:hypothetical protein
MIIGAQLPSVDGGGGWLIFALPPAEVAVHPADDDSGAHRLLHTQFYLMCDDLSATIKSLKLPSGGDYFELADVAQTLVSAAPRLISAFVHWSVQDVCAGSQPGKLNSHKEEPSIFAIHC